MIRLAKQTTRITPWLGVCFGLILVGWPIVAEAVQFRPPTGRGIPGRREGGGTRGTLACVEGSIPITALTPDFVKDSGKSDNLSSNVGWTTAAYPRFFWYIPKTRAKTADFILSEVDPQQPRSQKGVPLYRTTFSITGSPGIASLPLPSQASIPPLEEGKIYRWTVGLNCEGNSEPNGHYVEGTIQRVQPKAALAAQLDRANALGKVELYANNGYWVDALTELAELRYTSPKDTALVASWKEFLKSVKLEKVIDQPLIQCCQETSRTR